LILIAGIVVSLTRLASDAETLEDRIYREENARKVTHGWNEGHRSGKNLALDRARQTTKSLSSREIARLASLKRTEAGLEDPVEGRSFERGFVFGFHEGFKAPEKEEPDSP
jgi:hypothetical protein